MRAVGQRDVELLQAIGTGRMTTSNRTRGRSIHYRTADRLAGMGLVLLFSEPSYMGMTTRVTLTESGKKAAGLAELDLEDT